MTDRDRCPTCGQQKPTKRHLLLQMDGRTRDALFAEAKAAGVSAHRKALLLLRAALGTEVRP